MVDEYAKPRKRRWKEYTQITRELLDTIEVGDLVRVNTWSKPLEVKAVSENYFVMASEKEYSVCSKLPRSGGFGSPLCIYCENVYKFSNEKVNKQYLQEFEDGKAHISERDGTAIYKLYVKKGGTLLSSERTYQYIK